MAIIYRYKHQYEQAISIYQQAIEINTTVKNKKGLGICYGGLGTIYQRQDKHQLAIENYNKAIEIAMEIETPKDVGIWTGNIGIIYQQIGEMDRKI